MRPAGDVRGQSELPRPLTSFIGRDTEVADVHLRLLERPARLLTLIGPGGVGKTRLAIRLAEVAATAFADGVVFVPLAAITDAALVISAIAQALGLPMIGSPTLTDSVIGFLRQRDVLLVLDNFEQVQPAAADVATLLAACPGMVVLVTSRVPLHVAGEQRLPVAPLSLPSPASRNESHVDEPLATIAAAAAVQLFVARAQAITPGFVLDGGNGTAVAAICRRLDGLPLAIELAAARTHLLQPAELLARLSPALPLLTKGPDDAPDRLRTMRGAIAWSYALLTPEDQRLFRHLAVFAGGFTLEAAARVTGDGCRVSETVPDTRHPSPVTLDLVASLVDKSLLQRTSAAAESRFAMLEMVREFALEQLVASGEADAAYRAHALCFVALAEDARPRLLGPEGAAVLARLGTEHDNLRAALSWTIAAGETDLALRLCNAAWRFWWMHSLLEQGRTWLERVLALPDTGPATAALRPRTQVAAGYFARVQGDYARADALGVEALALARQIGDAEGSSAALHLLSMTATDRGELTEAQAYIEAGIAIDRSVQYDHGVAHGLSDLGDIALAQGRLTDAAALAEEALAIWRERGDAWCVARAQIGCGRIVHAQGDRARAVELMSEGLVGCANLGDQATAARGISELAAIAAERGELRLAARLYGSVAALRETIGAPLAPTERAGHDAAVVAIRAALPAEDFAAAWEEGRALSLEQAVAEAAALARETSATEGDRASSVLDLLTSRERDVLRLLARGWSDKEIAAELGIGRRTVSTHVAAVRAKLGAPSRSAAAAIAARDHLV